MEVTITSILDYHLAQLPENHIKKRQVLAMDEQQYEQLCKELKREVKKYKGYRVLKVINDESN